VLQNSTEFSEFYTSYLTAVTVNIFTGMYLGRLKPSGRVKVRCMVLHLSLSVGVFFPTFSSDSQVTLAGVGSLQLHKLVSGSLYWFPNLLNSACLQVVCMRVFRKAIWILM